MPPLPDVPGVRHAHHDLPTGVRLHVAEAGDPAAPPLLAVHGWPQHWWVWRDVMPALAETHRVLCPDLRGFGWSGQPADGDFAQERLADDVLALLDLLEVERCGFLGHDWGGWIGWLLGIRAAERIERMLLLGIVSPWPPRRASLLNAWRLAYQYPLAAPRLGPAIVRDGRAVRRVLGDALDDRAAAVFVDVLREPARAHASSLLYRHFQLRELPAIATGRYADARVEVPVRVLLGRRDGVLHPSQLGDLEQHAPRAEVELADGGHFLVDERPGLVIERARAWFG